MCRAGQWGGREGVGAKNPSADMVVTEEFASLQLAFNSLGLVKYSGRAIMPALQTLAPICGIQLDSKAKLDQAIWDIGNELKGRGIYHKGICRAGVRADGRVVVPISSAPTSSPAAAPVGCSPAMCHWCAWWTRV